METETSSRGESISSADTNSECSRLFVKNLPGVGKKAAWNEQKLRALFEKFGAITDVKLKLNDNNGACRFAFVGFEDHQSCEAALQKMNGSYLRGTKLQIEKCKPLSEERVKITREITASRMKRTDKLNEDCEPTSSDKQIEEQILDTGRLFVRNLPFVCTEEKLETLFKTFGPLAEIECIIDRKGLCKGYALCTFMFPEHALAAWKELDGKIFMGRMLHIIGGEEKAKKVDDGRVGNQRILSAFQKEREKARKETAEKAKHTWNSLFLGTNAVADALAENYEVAKRDLLLENGENSAAVRMAMAETRLVRETRKFLSDHGVKLDIFSQPFGTQRSKTVILVKNLDGKVGEREKLEEIFSRFGHVRNLIMPPEHGISCLVEMSSELDAKQAFEALAYNKRFSLTSGRPLYLEWAPLNVFDEIHPSRTAITFACDNEEKDAAANKAEKSGDEEEEKQGEDSGNAKTEEPERTKLLVRNVPFQANCKEVSQLFSAFGELKFVRMPKKPGDAGHRGFCFVDFISTGDARRAMDALAHSTHLYGRRLVLEWAKQESTIEELRTKTKRRAPIEGAKMKKSKMRSFEN